MSGEHIQKIQQQKTENAYELHAYQFLGVWLWRNYDTDDKSSTRVTRKLNRKKNWFLRDCVENSFVIDVQREILKLKHEVWDEIDNKTFQKLVRLKYLQRRSQEEMGWGVGRNLGGGDTLNMLIVERFLPELMAQELRRCPLLSLQGRLFSFGWLVA